MKFVFNKLAAKKKTGAINVIQRSNDEVLISSNSNSNYETVKEIPNDDIFFDSVKPSETNNKTEISNNLVIEENNTSCDIDSEISVATFHKLDDNDSISMSNTANMINNGSTNYSNNITENNDYSDKSLFNQDYRSPQKAKTNYSTIEKNYLNIKDSNCIIETVKSPIKPYFTHINKSPSNIVSPMKTNKINLPNLKLRPKFNFKGALNKNQKLNIQSNNNSPLNSFTPVHNQLEFMKTSQVLEENSFNENAIRDNEDLNIPIRMSNQNEVENNSICSRQSETHYQDNLENNIVNESIENVNQGILKISATQYEYTLCNNGDINEQNEDMFNDNDAIAKQSETQYENTCDDTSNINEQNEEIFDNVDLMKQSTTQYENACCIDANNINEDIFDINEEIVKQSATQSEFNNNDKQLIRSPTTKSIVKPIFNISNAENKKIHNSPSKFPNGSLDITPTIAPVLRIHLDSDNDSIHNAITTSVSVAPKVDRRKPFMLKKNKDLLNQFENLDDISIMDAIRLPPLYPPTKYTLEKEAKKRLRRENKKNNIPAITLSQSINETESEADYDIGKLRIDAEGNIVEDHPDEVVKPTGIMNTDDIVETGCFQSTYRTFSRKRLSGKKWTDSETTKFYTALAVVKTNFDMMESAFDGSRSRYDLKHKYKMEERKNPDKIIRVLNVHSKCDVQALTNLFKDDSCSVLSSEPSTKRQRITQN